MSDELNAEDEGLVEEFAEILQVDLPEAKMPTPTEGYSSDFRPCTLCGMPEFDHGDGSPTDHEYIPDVDWVEPEIELAPPLVPTRYSIRGNEVLRDGESIITTVEPEAAQGLVELLNEAVAHDRESHARVTAKVRRDRLRLLEDIIENPSRVTPRLKIEAPAHWAARAVMSKVDGWL